MIVLNKDTINQFVRTMALARKRSALTYDSHTRNKPCRKEPTVYSALARLAGRNALEPFDDDNNFTWCVRI